MIKYKVISIFFLFSFLSLKLDADNTLTKLDSLAIDLKSKIKHYPNKNDYTYAFLNIKLSDLYIKRDLLDTAFLIIERGLQSCKKTDINKKVLFLSEKGNYFKNIGQDSKAIECFLDADALINGVTEADVKINHAVNKAEFYRKLGKFQFAKKELMQANKLINKFKCSDSTILIKYFNRMAAVASESGVDSTVQYSLKAIQLSRMIKDGFSESISFNELGFYYKNRKMVDTSMNCYLMAEKKWREYGSYTNAIHAMLNRAQLISHNGLSKKESNTILKEILKIYEANHLYYPIDNVYDLIRDNYYFMGDSANYYRYKILAIEIRSKIDKQRGEADIRRVVEKYKNDSIKTEIGFVSERLKNAEGILEVKKSENKLAYILISILVFLMLIIAYLLYRLSISNKDLKVRYKEKEALVQEIHHRVKNNLQFVNSIINMQLNSVQNQHELMGLKDTSRRILSMSLVHEMLFNKDTESNIDMQQYLQELVKNMDDLSNTSNNKIEFVLDVEKLFFDVSKATAIGMITSELLSNSLKYAFEKTESPIIKISLKEIAPNTFILFYLDNGVGLPDNINKTNKLGMRLIDIFSRQIKGNYTFENNGGLSFKLEFVIKN